MIAFRGRVGFRQYIHGKPQPWGIKAYDLSEIRTGYMYNLLIYCGKETQRAGLNHTTNVVLTLVNPLANLSYDLYTDRFYTSPVLAEDLLKVRTTLTGTVTSNGKNMSAAVKSNRQKKGDVATYCKGQMVVVQWTDKRTLITLTTKHTNTMIPEVYKGTNTYFEDYFVHRLLCVICNLSVLSVCTLHMHLPV